MVRFSRKSLNQFWLNLSIFSLRRMALAFSIINRSDGSSKSWDYLLFFTLQEKQKLTLHLILNKQW